VGVAVADEEDAGAGAVDGGAVGDGLLVAVGEGAEVFVGVLPVESGGDFGEAGGGGGDGGWGFGGG